MNKIKKVSLTVVTVILCILLNTSAFASQNVDWSTVTLSGTFPSFSFSHSTLGDVTLSYSSNNVDYGMLNGLFAEPTLRLGTNGGESLTMSWSNPVTYFNMEIWDIDAEEGQIGEDVTFVTSATTSIVAIHPTDIWDNTTQNLSSNGDPNENSEVGNFSVLNFANPIGFDAITFNWEVTGGTGAMGIGEISSISVAPEPISSTLFIVGGATLGLRRFRKKFMK